MKSVWYISKYVKSSFIGNSGSRGFFLLNELSKKGFDCTIFSSYPFKNLKSYKKIISNINRNFKYVYIDSYEYRKANSSSRIISWLDFERKLFLLRKDILPKPDVVIVSSLSLLTIINGLILKTKYSCKLIFEVRDIWPLTLTEEGGFSNRNIIIIFLKFIEFIAYKYSDHIIGTMPNLKEHVEKVLGFPKKVSCVPMGFNSKELIEAEDIPKNIKRLIPKNKFIVGYFGGIGVSNALNSFFDTVNKLEKNKDIHFLVAGDGDLKNHYFSQTKHLKNITFLSFIEKKYIHSMISLCNLLYFSTHNSKVWKYGQSLNKLVDYMLTGVPIIGSYNGYQSMLNESECGEFISPSDSDELISKILKYKKMSPSKRKYIGVKGKNWILKNRSYEKLSYYLSEIISETT